MCRIPVSEENRRRKKRIPAAHSDLRSGDSFLCFFICFLFLFMYHFSFYSIRSNAVFLP